MSRARDYDGDACRKAAVEDGMPAGPWRGGLSPLLPPHPARSDEDIEQAIQALRRRAERLAVIVHELERADPPTMPDADEDALDAFCAAMEERVARAADRRGHRYARRTPGRPWSCTACARPIDRAAERCSTAGGTR